MSDAIVTKNEKLCKLLYADSEDRGCIIDIVEKSRDIRMLDFVIPMPVGFKRAHIDIYIGKNPKNNDFEIATSAHEETYYNLKWSDLKNLRIKQCPDYEDIFRTEVKIRGYRKDDIVDEYISKFPIVLTEGVELWIRELIKGTLYGDFVDAARKSKFFNENAFFDIVVSDFICSTAIASTYFASTDINNEILQKKYQKYANGPRASDTYFDLQADINPIGKAISNMLEHHKL